MTALVAGSLVGPLVRGSPVDRGGVIEVGRRLVRISRGLVSTGSSLGVGNRLRLLEPRVANPLGSITGSIFRIHLLR